MTLYFSHVSMHNPSQGNIKLVLICVVEFQFLVYHESAVSSRKRVSHRLNVIATFAKRINYSSVLLKIKELLHL